MDITCSYGCGQPFRFKLKNGRLCCESSHNRCPLVKHKKQKSFANSLQNKTPEERSNIAKRREIKKKHTIDAETGLPMNIVGAMRAAKTKTNTVDENGLNVHKQAGRKTAHFIKNISLEKKRKAEEHRIKCLYEIQPSGLTKAEEAARKGVLTRLKVGKDGLNSFERAWIKSNKMYRYKNTNILYQSSCEYSFLQDLENYYGYEWLITNVKRGPNISYIHPYSGKELKFMIDYQVGNFLYEIKSNYTYNGIGKRRDLLEVNEAKIDGARKSGFSAYILIYDKINRFYKRIER